MSWHHDVQVGAESPQTGGAAKHRDSAEPLGAPALEPARPPNHIGSEGTGDEEGRLDATGISKKASDNSDQCFVMCLEPPSALCCLSRWGLAVIPLKPGDRTRAG